jgi:hypothetical protein
MRTTKVQRITAFVLAVLLLVCGTFAVSAKNGDEEESTLSSIKELLNAISYNEYQKLEDFIEATDATSEIVGKGQLTLDHSGLTYDGTKNDKPWSFHIDIKHLPTYGMCTDVSRFYTFVDGEFVEFYPENKVVEKFFIATEEIHRLMGGKWQDFKF